MCLTSAMCVIPAAFIYRSGCFYFLNSQSLFQRKETVRSLCVCKHRTLCCDWPQPISRCTAIIGCNLLTNLHCVQTQHRSTGGMRMHTTKPGSTPQHTGMLRCLTVPPARSKSTLSERQVVKHTHLS